MESDAKPKSLQRSDRALRILETDRRFVGVNPYLARGAATHLIRPPVAIWTTVLTMQFTNGINLLAQSIEHCEPACDDDRVLARN